MRALVSNCLLILLFVMVHYTSRAQQFEVLGTTNWQRFGNNVGYGQPLIPTKSGGFLANYVPDTISRRGSLTCQQWPNPLGGWFNMGSIRVSARGDTLRTNRSFSFYTLMGGIQLGDYVYAAAYGVEPDSCWNRNFPGFPVRQARMYAIRKLDTLGRCVDSISLAAEFDHWNMQFLCAGYDVNGIMLFGYSSQDFMPISCRVSYSGQIRWYRHHWVPTGYFWPRRAFPDSSGTYFVEGEAQAQNAVMRIDTTGFIRSINVFPPDRPVRMGNFTQRTGQLPDGAIVYGYTNTFWPLVGDSTFVICQDVAGRRLYRWSTIGRLEEVMPLSGNKALVALSGQYKRGISVGGQSRTIQAGRLVLLDSLGNIEWEQLINRSDTSSYPVTGSWSFANTYNGDCYFSVSASQTVRRPYYWLTYSIYGRISGITRYLPTSTSKPRVPANGLAAWPSPTAGPVRYAPAHLPCQVLDGMGRVVAHGREGQADLSALPPGLYTLRLGDGRTARVMRQ